MSSNLNNINKWLIIVIPLIIITVMSLYFSSQNMPNMQSVNIDKYSNVHEDIDTTSTKKIKIMLTKDQFNKLKIKPDTTIYYFPDDCDDFEEGKLLRTFVNNFEKYFIPEKNYLIVVVGKHEWTKLQDPNSYWILHSDEQTTNINS